MVYEQLRIADPRTPELSHYRAHSKSNPVTTVYPFKLACGYLWCRRPVYSKSLHGTLLLWKVPRGL